MSDEASVLQVTFHMLEEGIKLSVQYVVASALVEVSRRDLPKRGIAPSLLPPVDRENGAADAADNANGGRI